MRLQAGSKKPRSNRSADLPSHFSMQLRGFAVVYVLMKLRWTLVCLCFAAVPAFAQIQVELKFPRLQYIAYEPVVANLVITNLAGRDVDLRDADGQSWFGFEVTDARPIWQKTVGVPEGESASGNVRTYSLMTNRFPDHTSLYVRVEDKDSGIVYATYSLGQVIAFDQPQAEFDRSNQLHVLYCAAPRNWSYARIGLNGELLSRASVAETRTRPQLVHSEDGVVKISGGMMDTPVTQATRDTAPKLS